MTNLELMMTVAVVVAPSQRGKQELFPAARDHGYCIYIVAAGDDGMHDNQDLLHAKNKNGSWMLRKAQLVVVAYCGHQGMLIDGGYNHAWNNRPSTDPSRAHDPSAQQTRLRFRFHYTPSLVEPVWNSPNVPASSHLCAPFYQFSSLCSNRKCRDGQEG